MNQHERKILESRLNRFVQVEKRMSKAYWTKTDNLERDELIDLVDDFDVAISCIQYQIKDLKKKLEEE